ncbi:MAG TPA: HEAT repeat domain-containing protein [Rectinemataceae bacterium]|nr:HEAT repeat domain-containing protein [Rectinemataceae bacterium]
MKLARVVTGLLLAAMLFTPDIQAQPIPSASAPIAPVATSPAPAASPMQGSSSTAGSATAPATPPSAAPSTPPAPALTTSSTATSTSSASPSSSAASKAAADAIAKKRAIILYGIDSELIDLFNSLTATKDSTFNADTKDVFERSKDAKLRGAILELWRSLAWKGGEQDGAKVVTDRDNEDPAVVASALGYLGEIKSKAVLPEAKTILDENNSAVVPALISMLGKVGADPEVDLLLTWLKGDTALPAFREAAIRALGDIGSKKAADWLATTLGDNGVSRFERVIAAESLGKIALPASVDPLVKAAQSDDALVRAAAVGALGDFTDKAAEDAIVESLRDSYPAARVAGCKAIAKRKLVAALPNLEYKAQNDPDKGVKTEAIKSIAALGGKDAFGFLATIMDDANSPVDLRQLAFGLLMRDDAAGSMKALLARLTDEAKATDRTMFTALTREIAGAADASAAAPLAKILLRDKDYLIRLGGLQWARATKSPDIKADVAALASSDPSEAVKKFASQVLSLY